MLALAIIFSIITIGVGIFLICYFSHNKYKDFVRQNSIYLQQINEINSRYSFYNRVNCDQYNTYDNKSLYDNVSCKDYLIYQLQYIERDVCAQINKTSVNINQYYKYIEEVKALDEPGRYSSSIGILRRKKLIQIETKLSQKLICSAPPAQFYLTVTLRYSKMNGQVCDIKTDRFYADEILTLIQRIHNKSGSFYRDREIWDAMCRVERAKVSNKMRFAIYERDGHKCCNCGVSDQYVNLEIDHIVPISKGGKSTYDNLQTLCHECNVEKGNHL